MSQSDSKYTYLKCLEELFLTSESVLLYLAVNSALKKRERQCK